MSSGKRRRTEAKESQSKERSEGLIELRREGMRLPLKVKDPNAGNSSAESQPKRATRRSLGALPQGTVRRIIQLNKTVGSPVPETVVEAVGFCTEHFLHLLVKASLDQARACKRKTIRTEDMMAAIQANSTQLKFLTDVFGPPL